jgi:fructose-1,6-bisphosphatase/inositol monophosphatase family enzyme
MTDELKGLLYFAEELGLWAIDYIGSRRPAEVSTKKGPSDFVTEIDRAVEQHVREVIADHFDDHSVIGEEFGATGSTVAEYRWYVDPVDGTTNYAHGVPWSSFSLGLVDGAGPAVGVVADPARGELFSAVRGGGARLGGLPIRCSETTEVAGSVLLTEWAGHQAWPGFLPMLDTLAKAECTTRIMGSSALSVATVAAGRADAVVLGGYNTWDVAAGVLIAREAGVRTLGRDGAELPAVPGAGDHGLLAATPGIADAILAAWQND